MVYKQAISLCPQQIVDLFSLTKKASLQWYKICSDFVVKVRFDLVFNCRADLHAVRDFLSQLRSGDFAPSKKAAAKLARPMMIKGLRIRALERTLLGFSIVFRKTFIFMLSLLLLATPAFGEIYLGDHFDSQADWAPSQTCPNDPDRQPPPPWEYVLCDTELFINSSAAHGGSGKGFGINWPRAMDEIGLHAPASVQSGKTELWIGFWWRHNSWNWGGDKTYKWFRFFGGGGNTHNLNFDNKHRMVLNNGDIMQSDISFNTGDTGWHYWIIYMKHNSGGSNGQFRLWKDGTEANWYYAYTSTLYNNLGISFGSGSTWSTAGNLTWGYQSRPDWGSGNKTYWDDIVVASSRSEVEDFLGVGGSPGSAPLPPTELRIID
jgi:hypothetical protein